MHDYADVDAAKAGKASGRSKAAGGDAQAIARIGSIDRMHRDFGNRAVQRMLGTSTRSSRPPTSTPQATQTHLGSIQRTEGDYNWLTEGFNSVTGAGDAVQAAAEAALPNAVNIRCIRHYRAGTGSPLLLTSAEVQTMAVYANLFDNDSFLGIRAAQRRVVTELQRRQAETDAANPEATYAGFRRQAPTAGLEEPFENATGHCGTGGLGTATMHATGRVIYNPAGWFIEGTFTLYDYWDFDTRWRGLMLTSQTLAGRMFLPGRPFSVTSEPVPFSVNSAGGNQIVAGNGQANGATSQR